MTFHPWLVQLLSLIKLPSPASVRCPKHLQLGEWWGSLGDVVFSPSVHLVVRPLNGNIASLHYLSPCDATCAGFRNLKDTWYELNVDESKLRKKTSKSTFLCLQDNLKSRSVESHSAGRKPSLHADVAYFQACDVTIDASCSPGGSRPIRSCGSWATCERCHNQ